VAWAPTMGVVIGELVIFLLSALHALLLLTLHRRRRLTRMPSSDADNEPPDEHVSVVRTAPVSSSGSNSAAVAGPSRPSLVGGINAGVTVTAAGNVHPSQDQLRRTARDRCPPSSVSSPHAPSSPHRLSAPSLPSVPTTTTPLSRRRRRSPSPPTTTASASTASSSRRTMIAPARDTPTLPQDNERVSDSGLLPTRIAPLLCCPCCPPRTRLVDPTTLRCGHTVCAVHLHSNRSGAPPSSSSRCPLPTCRPGEDDTLRPRIPHSSSVVYIPAHADAIPVPSSSADSGVKSDVTLNKLIGLVERAERQLAEEVPLIHLGSSDDDDEEAGDGPPPLIPPVSPLLPSIPLGSDTPGSPNIRPRKRRRARAPSGPTLPLPPPHVALAPWFEKELLGELTCEICYMMFYQPVTTPCQHVRSFIFSLAFIALMKLDTDILLQMFTTFPRSQQHLPPLPRRDAGIRLLPRPRV
jgi:hypothetical protein